MLPIPEKIGSPSGSIYTTQIAAGLGITRSSVISSIKLEKEGRISINKLHELAEAMECDLEIILDQAIKKTIGFFGLFIRIFQLGSVN